jgi:hypothetical protein
MQGECAVSNACKVASSNGQPFGQTNKKQGPQMIILAHFGSKLAKIRSAAGFQGGQSGGMQGACAASNACKVASSNGQPFGPKKKTAAKCTNVWVCMRGKTNVAHSCNSRSTVGVDSGRARSTANPIQAQQDESINLPMPPHVWVGIVVGHQLVSQDLLGGSTGLCKSPGGGLSGTIIMEHLLVVLQVAESILQFILADDDFTCPSWVPGCGTGSEGTPGTQTALVAPMAYPAHSPWLGVEYKVLIDHRTCHSWHFPFFLLELFLLFTLSSP